MRFFVCRILNHCRPLSSLALNDAIRLLADANLLQKY
jgi:hypothetical protein